MKYEELRSIFLIIEKIDAAGGSMMDSLDIINNGISISRSTKKKMLKVTKEVNSGIKFSQALKNIKAIDEISYQTIKAAEFGGSFSKILKMLLNYIKNKKDNTRRINKLIIKILVNLMISLSSINFTIKYTMPKLQGLIKSGKKDTSMLNTVFMFISNNILIISLSLILTYVISKILENANVKIGSIIGFIKIKFPVFGNLILANDTYRYVSLLELMISSKINLQTAIKFSTNIVSNKAYKAAVTRVYNNMIEGSSFSNAAKMENIIPYDLSSMVSIGERTGNFTGLLGTLKDYYMEKIELYISRLENGIKIFNTCLIGLLLFWLVNNTMIPLYSGMSSQVFG